MKTNNTTLWALFLGSALIFSAYYNAEGKYYGGKKVYPFNETVHTKIIEIK